MDIRCQVCGEYWDAWGANHGDMAFWQYDLFRKGAGCPCCQGESNNQEEIEPNILHVENPNDFYPMVDKAEWKEPEEKVIFTCSCCKSELRQYNDRPYDGSKLHGNDEEWYYWKTKTPYNEPKVFDKFEHNGETYCDNCVTTCEDCGKFLFTNNEQADLGDVYDEGYSFIRKGDEYYKNPDYLCIDCYQNDENEQNQQYAIDEIDSHIRNLYKEDFNNMQEVKEDLDNFINEKLDKDEYYIPEEIIDEKVKEFWEEN
jgi:hypothetical protein